MKKNKLIHFSAAAVASLVLASFSAKADTLAQWTFESTFASISGTSATFGGLTPEILQAGATAAASGSHAGAGTVWSSPSGNGSSHSFSANLWAQGTDFFQFTLTPNPGTYSNIEVSYDQNGSATGPKTFYFAYSTDGSSFTTVGADYALTSAITWTTTGSLQGTHESFDLSAITDLNTASTWYFRIYNDSPATGGAINGGNVGAGGTDRIDNFTINAVPEPTTTALVGGFGLLAWFMARRRR